jgi:hypothetical protein
VARALACQKKLDKAATAFGPLSSVCDAGLDPSAAARAEKAIAKACRRKVDAKTFTPIAGGEVGSCEPLPSCVITDAAATGTAAAGSIYKAPLICGDGTIDAGEDCDPGIDVGGDCCTAGCRFVPGGTQCRAAQGVCDLAEACSGTDALCPLDAKSTAICQDPGNPCVPSSQCDGVSNDCPTSATALARRQQRAGENVRSLCRARS